jgi:hypothetical protein
MLEQTIDPKIYQGGSQAGYGSPKNQRPDSDINLGSQNFRKKQIIAHKPPVSLVKTAGS